MSQGELPLSPSEAACFFLSLSSESEGVSQYTFEQGASQQRVVADGCKQSAKWTVFSPTHGDLGIINFARPLGWSPG